MFIKFFYLFTVFIFVIKDAGTTVQTDWSEEPMFILFLKSYPKEVILLDIDQPDSLFFFKSSRETKIIIHDYGTDSSSDTPQLIIQAYLKSSKRFNIVAVDWHNLSMFSSYRVARKYINKLGKHVGKLIEFLINIGQAKPTNIHVIGYGMGAEMATYAGRYTNGTIGRITALNPFKSKTEAFKSVLRSSDALFVDVITTTWLDFMDVDSLSSATFFIISVRRNVSKSPLDFEGENIIRQFIDNELLNIQC